MDVDGIEIPAEFAQEAEGGALTKEQFCERFVAYMTKHAPFTCFKNEDGTDAETVAEYAEATAPTYWDEPRQRQSGPEECAEADMSYWGE